MRAPWRRNAADKPGALVSLARPTGPPNSPPVAVPLALVSAQRSVRWLNTIASALYGLITFLIGVALIWGPVKWHQGPSMHLVAGLGWSWDVWGAAYMLQGAMIAVRPTRIYGYFLGFVLYGYFSLSLVRLMMHGNLGSVVLLGAIFTAAVSQAVAAVRAMILAGER